CLPVVVVLLVGDAEVFARACPLLPEEAPRALQLLRRAGPQASRGIGQVERRPQAVEQRGAIARERRVALVVVGAAGSVLAVDRDVRAEASLRRAADAGVLARSRSL